MHAADPLTILLLHVLCILVHCRLLDGQYRGNRSKVTAGQSHTNLLASTPNPTDAAAAAPAEEHVDVMSSSNSDASAGSVTTFERGDEAAALAPGPAVAPAPCPPAPVPPPAAPSPTVPQVDPAAQVPPSRPASHQLAAAPPPPPKPKRMAPPPAASTGRESADESTVAAEAGPVADSELPVPSVAVQHSLPARGTTKEEREQAFFRAQKEAKEAENARHEAQMMAMSPEVRSRLLHA